MDMSGAGNAEEQGQGKSLAAPGHSTAARFQIRSAKERQSIFSKEPTKGLKTAQYSRFEGGMVANVRSKNSSDGGKEELRARPNSPPTPDSDVTDKRAPRGLNQVSAARHGELPVGSETSDATQEKPDCVGSLTTRARGRTEWRGPNLTNRSKSLDWRGFERGKENQTVAIRNTTDFKVLRRSESLQDNGPGNSPKPNEPTSPSNSVSLRIQAYNAIGQGKQNGSANISPGVSGSSSVRISRVALALERASGGQSLPSRLKRIESQDSTEDKKSPWWLSGQGSPKSAQTDIQLCSQVSESKVSEVTGNQTIMDRIGKLYRLNASEDNTDANSRDSIRAKRYSAPVGDWFYSPDAVDSKTSHRSSMKDGIDFTSTTDTPSALPSKNMRRDASSTMPVSPGSTWSKERPLGKDLTSLMTGISGWNVRTQLGEPVERLGTHSLDRARSRNSPAALSRALRTQESSCPASDSSMAGKAFQLTRQDSIIKEVESDRQVDQTTACSTHVKAMEIGPKKQINDSPGIHSFGKNGTGQPKPQLSRSVTVDGERYKGNDDVFELGSLTLPRMKRLSLQEKGQAQSVDSVRKKIHKFESLAHQNQKPSQTLRTRRTFSVPEKPYLPLEVSKSNSDKSLSEWKGVWNARNLSDDPFRKCDVSEEIISAPDQSGPADKGSPAMKTQSREGYREGPEVALKQLDKFASSDQSPEVQDNVKDDVKTTEMTRHLDEPDTVRAHLGVAISNNTSKDFSRSQTKCSSDAKDDEANLQIQESPPGNSTTAGAQELQAPESIPVFPDSVSTSSIKSSSTANSTQPKSPSVPQGDSTVTTAVPSTQLNDLSNICGTTRDEKVAAKVSRWITNKRDDVNVTANDSDDNNDDDENEDEDDEDGDEGTERGDDSDSGESSVTITSDISQSDHRSFSLSLADLCNLGGLDYPPSDGNGSMDEEKWMSKRSASLSSDISVLSSVTLLATEELDCLLDDVKGLGDDALENFEDVQVVVLHKEVGRGLGFTVAGGVDQNKPVTVHRVFPCGAAGQEGSIQEGDQVLSINGTALHNSAHWEALRTLRKARARGMAVVVLRPGNTTETQHSTKEGLHRPTGNPGSKVHVTLTKASYDLGFSLEGGVGSSLGDKPLTVQRIFQGGPVGKVFPGDELLEIQGQTLSGLRRLEAWNLIKRLPPGPVEVLLHRPHQPY
ncbi:uncharacterized protein [Salminus brasiliensis]|uniref:uncharacterized protein isoform X2 n=1 Tax=Salminus brasiliensis TaxID=930266 RepID=UPI003B836033